MLAADTEEVALSFENANLNDNNAPVKTDRIRHPMALGFHLLFKSLAILLYLFGTLFFTNFITIFVIIMVLLSMDFWTVKNISGRLLVGLRWWNYVDDEGKSNWVFENRKTNSNQQNADRLIVESTFETNIFWLSLIVVDLLWIVFFLLALFTFSFKWITIILVAVMLNASNTYGFLKCKFGSEKNMQNVATSFFGKQMLKSMFEKTVSSNLIASNNPPQQQQATP